MEVAGSIAKLARHTLARHFRRVRPAEAGIHVIEAGPRLLGGFREDLGRRARDHQTALGVSVRTGARVERIARANLVVGWRRMGCGLVVFAADVTAPLLARAWGLRDRPRRSHPGRTDDRRAIRSDAFASGDVAACRARRVFRCRT